VNSSAKAAAVAFLGLLGAGVVLRPIEAVGSMETAGSAGAVGDGNLGPLLGRGLSAAVLGGFRALAADGLWLRAYLAWAERDVAQTEALISLVTLVDERPLCFWLDGARILAYDVPQWRIANQRVNGPVPAEVRRRITEEQASVALRYLEQARRSHPDSAAICVEIANVHLNVRRDLGAAAGWYRRAAETPNAPYYAARIHAELLKRLGRSRDAYQWLRDLHPTLPPCDDAAMRDIILKRIRDLEDFLAIPPGERYLDSLGTDRPVDQKDG